MESNFNLLPNSTTSTLTRKFSQTQRSPKKDNLSPIHIPGVSEKYNMSETSTLPPGFCTTPRLKKAHSLKYFTSVEGSMPKLGHILRELYDTEIDYVNALETTVDVYLVALEKEKSVDTKVIFGNIKDVLQFHKYTFLPRLEEVYHSAEEVSGLLQQSYKEFMQLYVKYCLMICESSQLLKSKFFKSFFKNIRETTKDKQSLSDYLIRPVQRITRYELILNQMIHTYQKAGVPCPYIEKAYSVIKEVPTLADNAMKLNSILNYKEKFNVQHLRQLRLHNIFIVSDRDKRFSHKKYYVFLMVDRIIFTKICGDTSITELLCTFKSELLFSEDSVSIKQENVPDKDQRIFVLLKGKKEISMQAEKVEIKEKWVAQINELVIHTNYIHSNRNSEISETECLPIESPPHYEDYFTGAENHSSNADDELGEDLGSDMMDLKQYCVIEDFNPDETMNGFIALRKGQIYEVDYKLLAHWHVVLVGHINPNSNEYWNGFEGFAYPQFLQARTMDAASSSDLAISPDSSQSDENAVPLGYQSLPIDHERNISIKSELPVLDTLNESDNFYSPLVPKRTYNKTGASKLSSSLTRKLQLAKNTRYTPDRQSITEEDSVSGFDSARSSISNSDSFVNGRDMFYSVTSETEYEPTQESDTPDLEIPDDLYNVFIKSNSIADQTRDIELNITTPVNTTTKPNLPTLSSSREIDNSFLYKLNRDSFGHIGEQVLLKYGSREELNADIPPDGREENPIIDDQKSFSKTTNLSPHHKSDSIPANLNILDRDCEGSSRTKTAKPISPEKLKSRPYAPLKRSSSDQSKKIFNTQINDKNAAIIEPRNEAQETIESEEGEPNYPRKRSNSIHKIIERFNSCSTDPHVQRKNSNLKRHSLFVTNEVNYFEDDELDDKYKTLTPSAGKSKLLRTLSFDKDTMLAISDLNSNEIGSPERPGSTETLKNPIFCDQKSPHEELNPPLPTERKTSESHTLIIATHSRTRSVSPEPYKLPIKITTKKVISVPLPPAIKPKPKISVRSTASNSIVGNFEISDFNQIFETSTNKGVKKADSLPPPVFPKNRTLIGSFKVPVISKPLQNTKVSMGRLADISFEIESEIENMQIEWYKDSLPVSSRRYTASVNGCVCALKIWEFGEFDQATYGAIIKTRGGHASTKCDVKLRSK